LLQELKIKPNTLMQNT